MISIFCICRSELIWIPHQSTRFARMVFSLGVRLYRRPWFCGRKILRAATAWPDGCDCSLRRTTIGKWAASPARAGSHLPPGPRARRPCAQGRERHDRRLCRSFCALVGVGRRSARGRRPGADTVSAAELRPRDQRVRVALGGDLPGPLMQLRRMLKPDGLLSRLAHACGVMEPHPARAAKKRSIATIIWGDRRFESCSSSGESLPHGLLQLRPRCPGIHPGISGRNHVFSPLPEILRCGTPRRACLKSLTFALQSWRHDAR